MSIELLNSSSVITLNTKSPTDRKPLPNELPLSKAAARRFSQSTEKSKQYEKLTSQSVAHLNGSNASLPTVQRTASRIMRCWNWACRTRPIKWGVTKSLKALRLGLTFHSIPKSDKNKNERELSKLTGSEHLVQLLQILAKPLSKELQELLVVESDNDTIKSFFIKTFLKDETSALNQLISTMLPAMCLHLVKHVRESICEETGKYPETVSLLDIICCLSDLVKSHLPHIAERIQMLEGKADSAKHEQKILQLFIPLTDELMAILFPEAQNDLPLAKLPIAPGYAWSLLRNSVIPGALMSGYQKLMQPFHSGTGLSLQNCPRGSSLVSLAETAGLQTGREIPALFTAGSPALQLIKEVLGQLCKDKRPEYKQWLLNWLVGQVETIAKSDRKEISSIFNFCGHYMTPLLLHIFSHLAAPPIVPEKAKGLLPDAIGMMSIKLLAVLSQFMNTHGEAVAARIIALQNTSMIAEDDIELLNIFSHLAHDLIRIAGLNNNQALPVPDFLREAIGTNIKAALPKFLIQQYTAIQEGCIEDVDVRKKLRSFFFDEKKLQDPAIGTNVITFLHSLGSTSRENLFDEFYQQLWEQSGTDRIVRTLEGMCAVLANDFVESALSNLGISSQNALKAERNPFMKKLSAYLKNLTETIVLRILTQALSTTSDSLPAGVGEHPHKFLAANVLMRLIESCHKGLKNVDEKLKEIDKTYGDDPALHAVERRKVFAKLADDVHAISGKNPFTHLPFNGLPAPDSLKDLLWQTVKTVALPDFLAAQFDDLAGWDRQSPDSFDKLEDCYHTSHSQWACKVLAQYGTDFIRHYMATEGDHSAKLLFNAILSYLNTSSSTERGTAKDLLEQQAEEIKSLLESNLSSIGDYQGAPMIEVWPLLTRYLEGVIAKFLSGLSSTVRTIEANNPDFMVDIAINMLKDTADYFKIVNDIVQTHDEEHAYTINPASIITGFRENLHDGVPMDPALPEAEKDKVRLQGCFIPRAMNLLELANISINDFPLPAAFRQPLGELIVGTLLPLVLLRADQNALGHHIRDALMLNFVQTLYAALNGIELIKEDEVIEESKPVTDPKQKRLNETCGSVVLELVKLIPDTMVQYVFMKEKVQNMSAEAIGQATMPHLSRWTLLQLIDTVIYVSLPGLHPAKWEGKVGREVLIPRKAFIKPNGNMALKPVRKFKFHFPRTPLEIQEDRLKRVQFANKTRLQLRDGFTKIISNQLRIKLWEAVKSIWAQFQGQLDVLVERQFPTKGLEIKKFLDAFFRRLFFDLIGSVIQFLSLPFVNGLEFLVQKMYIDTKSKEIIENLHSDALENLVYKWMDTLLDTLLALKTKD